MEDGKSPFTTPRINGQNLQMWKQQPYQVLPTSPQPKQRLSLSDHTQRMIRVVVPQPTSLTLEFHKHQPTIGNRTQHKESNTTYQPSRHHTVPSITQPRRRWSETTPPVKLIVSHGLDKVDEEGAHMQLSLPRGVPGETSDDFL